VRNNEAGMATIVASLGRAWRGPGGAGGDRGYARKLTGALIEADVTVFMVNPRRIKLSRG
jgi:hypothetical protein